MEDIKILFEQSDDLDHIEIVVRAPRKSARTDALIKKISGITNRKLRVVDSKGCDCLIDESEIISVCSADRQVRVITENDIYTSNLTLRGIEELLEKKRFIKISRYELINSERIVKFDFTIGGTLRLELDGGIETWASRRYIPLIRKHLSGEGESE